MECKYCGNTPKKGVNYCTKCGKQIESQPLYNCAKCGTNIKEGYNFCSKCGYAYTDNIKEPIFKQKDTLISEDSNIKYMRDKSRKVSFFSIMAMALILVVMSMSIIVYHQQTLSEETENASSITSKKTTDMTSEVDPKKISPVAAGWCHSSVLQKDGTVKSNFTIATAEDLTQDDGGISKWENIISICAGDVFVAGLKTNGTVVVAGDNWYNEKEAENWSDIISIDAGMYAIYGIKHNGTVLYAGLNENEEGNVSEWTDIESVSGGDGHVLGLKIDGTVVATGLNDYGQCNVSEWTDVIAIGAGSLYSVGLLKDGTVVVTGEVPMNQEEFNKWENIIAIAVGYDYTIGLKNDGNVMAVIDNSGEFSIEKKALNDIEAISSGGWHAVFLRKDGAIFTAGNTGDGVSTTKKLTLQ